MAVTERTLTSSFLAIKQTQINQAIQPEAKFLSLWALTLFFFTLCLIFEETAEEQINAYYMYIIRRN
jgi:hypothetical protein